MSMPNCVPEFYREQEEREERKYELRHKREIGYQADCEILSKAEELHLPVLYFCGYYKCNDCMNRSKELITDEDDDLCRFVCYNPYCDEHSKNK